jgi:hypothetical protein
MSPESPLRNRLSITSPSDHKKIKKKKKRHLPSIAVKVVQINLDARGNRDAHVRETLGREAIARVQVALVPLDLLEGRPRIIGDSVQTRTKGHASGSGRTMRVVIRLINVGVEVEVLLEVHDVKGTLGELAANEPGIGGLVAWDIVVVEDGRKTSDVVGEEAEGSGGLGSGKLEDEGQDRGHAGKGDEAVHL